MFILIKKIFRYKLSTIDVKKIRKLYNCEADSQLYAKKTTLWPQTSTKSNTKDFELKLIEKTTPITIKTTSDRWPLIARRLITFSILSLQNLGLGTATKGPLSSIETSTSEVTFEEHYKKQKKPLTSIRGQVIEQIKDSKLKFVLIFL